MENTILYYDILSNDLYDEAGNLFGNRILDIFLNNHMNLEVHYVALDGSQTDDPTSFPPWTGLTDVTVASSVAVDNNMQHAIKGVLAEELSIGAVSSIKVTAASTTINPTGTIVLIDGAGERLGVPYTAVSYANGAYTFTVSVSLDQAYPAGSTVRVPEALIMKAEGDDVDDSKASQGIFVFKLYALSHKLIELLDYSNTSSISATMQHKIISEGEVIRTFEYELTIRNVLEFENDSYVPAAGPDEVATKSWVLSFYRSPFEYQFSVDKSEWHDVQTNDDRYYRQRIKNSGSEYGDPIAMVVGPKGDAGTTPSINSSNNHWMLGETDTGVSATGPAGADGLTPSIDADTKHWLIGTQDTGVVAEGKDGTTPHIGENGNWYIGDTDTGVSAGSGYELPVASSGTLGGIKVGANLSITGEGVLSANASQYELPIASSSTLGGIKISSDFTIDEDGTLHTTSSGGSGYVLPVATASTLGGVKQGTNVTIAADGTLSATYKVDSTNWWDRTTSSTFTIPFYVDGMYKKSNINFSFVTNKINATIDKFNKIEELKKTKYAKDITKKEVLDNFFVYNIKDKGDNKFTITENMITLTPVGNVLRVRVTLPVNSFPSGTPANLLNYSYEFTGFKDTSGYTFHFLTNDEQKQSDNVKLLKSSKYPSEIEYDSQTMILTDNGTRDLFNNFIQLGFSYNTNYSSWEVKLKSVDNVNGTLVIDYIKYVDTSVGADFPEELKNVLGNTTLTEFKKLTDNFRTPPKMIKYVGNLTPLGLWNEYQTLLNNGNPEQSTLIRSLSYGLANPKNLDIKVTNLGTSTKDKKLNLEISLKDDAITNLIVNGKYLTLDKQTNDSLKKSLNDVYPYNVTWEIDSQSYVFEWDTNNNKEGVTETDNSLSIDIEKAKYDFMNSNMYVDEVKDQDLLSLFTLQNYEISETPEISRNRSAGTITIVFSINQVDPGQGQTRVAIYNDGSDSISDNQKIIFIKNFKIPFSPVTQYIPAIILSIALVVLVLIIMMLITKSRTSVIENPLSRKRKKFKKLTRIKK